MSDLHRDWVETLLGQAQKAIAHQIIDHCSVAPETLAELCEAWLALDAAPVGEVFDLATFDHLGDLLRIECLDETGLQVGQAVRLVATPTTRGPSGE